MEAKENYPLANIKQIQEVVSSVDSHRPYRGGESPVRKVNCLLKEGWVLLAIHRHVLRPDDSVEEVSQTLYVLGNTTPEPDPEQ